MRLRLLAVRVIPSAGFNFETALPVMTASCHPSACRAVPAPPSSEFSTQAALRIDPPVVCPMGVQRKRPGMEKGKHKQTRREQNINRFMAVSVSEDGRQSAVAMLFSR